MKKQAPQTLDEYLRPRGSLTRLARQLDVPLTYLCDIRKGRRVPPLKLAARIEDATGGVVPIRSLLGRAA